MTEQLNNNEITKQDRKHNISDIITHPFDGKYFQRICFDRTVYVLSSLRVKDSTDGVLGRVTALTKTSAPH